MTQRGLHPFHGGVAKVFVESNTFTNLVTFAILLNAFTIGLQTYPATVAELEAQSGIALNTVFSDIDTLVLGIFSIEALAKIRAYGKSYFEDNWNIFDILVILVSLLSFSPLFAVLRVVRVVRLLRRIQTLRLISSIILRSASGCLSIVGLMFLVLFIFAVASHALYGQSHPNLFGNLHTAIWTLFKAACIVGWVEELAQQLLAQHPGIYLFLVPYFLLMNFIILNFFFSIVCLYLEELSYADLRYGHAAVHGNETAAESSSVAVNCLSEEAYQSLLQELAELREKIRQRKLSGPATN